MDKLRSMQFFCRAVEAGSFARAAAALNVVPSAFSKGIAALEDDIGFRLLNRSTRRMSLTEEGSAYYEKCRAVLQQVDDMEAGSRSDSRQLRGTLRVGMHPALREVLLTKLGVFMGGSPNITVETDVTNSPSAIIERGLRRRAAHRSACRFAPRCPAVVMGTIGGLRVAGLSADLRCAQASG